MCAAGSVATIRLAERRPADPARGRVAQANFDILAGGTVVGQLRLRLEDTEEIVRHAGHIGYDVAPEHRGQGHAAAAVMQVLPHAREAGLHVVWITCSPANIASQRTATNAGAAYVETIDLPDSSEMFARGERAVRRYRLMTR